MGALIFLVYSAWAVYSGYKMVNGRYAWLEQEGIVNVICKWLAIIGMGYILGVFYLLKWVVKIALRITDGFR